MQNDKYFFFWKHRLSQWHIVNFTAGSYTYNCCEQYMMHLKAVLMRDPETAAEIMNEKNPYNHQTLGRKIKNFNQEVWDMNKYSVVLTGNRARFTQSAECRELLLATGDKILVEASPYDKVWGIAMGVNDPDILDETKWRGQNLLGKVLTQVREELKAEILQP